MSISATSLDANPGTGISGAVLQAPLLTASDLCWTLPPAICPPWRPVLATAIEPWPAIEDTHIAALVARLALAIVDQGDELRSVRAVLSASLTHAHGQHVEIVRLKTRLAELLEARQQERTSVTTQGQGQAQQKLRTPTTTPTPTTRPRTSPSAMTTTREAAWT